jgi:hypothetical protein
MMVFAKYTAVFMLGFTDPFMDTMRLGSMWGSASRVSTSAPLLGVKILRSGSACPP